MTSEHCPTDSRRKGTFAERRALMACIRCRRLKKRCRPGGSSGCQRCCAAGRECQYMNVADETPSPHVLGTSSLASSIAVVTGHEGTSDVSPLLINAKYVQQPQSQCFVTPSDMDVNSQPFILQSNPYPPTHQTHYISDNLYDTRPNNFCHPTISADLAALALYEFEGTLSASESAQYDQWTSDQTPPSRASMPMVDVYGPAAFGPTNSLDNQHNSGPTQPTFNFQSPYEDDPPFETYDNSSANTISSGRHGVCDLKFFMPMAPAGTSDPYSPCTRPRTRNTPTTYSQDTSASSYNSCSFCRPGFRCVVHSEKSDYH